MSLHIGAQIAAASQKGSQTPGHSLGHRPQREVDRVRLSGREEMVVRLFAEGFTDKEVAHRLGIGLPTVRTYWTRIKGKVGCGSRAAVVAKRMAVRHTPGVDLGIWQELAQNLPFCLTLVNLKGTIEFVSRDHEIGHENPVGKALRDLVPMPTWRAIEDLILEVGRTMKSVRFQSLVGLPCRAGRIASGQALPFMREGSLEGIILLVDE